MIGDAKNAGEQVEDRWIWAHSVWQMRSPFPLDMFRGPWVVTSRHAVVLDDAGTLLPVVRARCDSIGPTRHIERAHFLRSFWFVSANGHSATDLVRRFVWSPDEARALTDRKRWKAPKPAKVRA